MDFAAGGIFRWDNLRVTQNEIVADSCMADTIRQDLVDLNQHFRVLVLRTLNGVRSVVFEREVALAETWQKKKKG